MYEMWRRKSELTLLPIQGIFNLPHHICMIWRGTGLWWCCKLYTAQEWIVAQQNVMAVMGFVSLFPGSWTQCLNHLNYLPIPGREKKEAEKEHSSDSKHHAADTIGWLLKFYVLATSKVISGRADATSVYKGSVMLSLAPTTTTTTTKIQEQQQSVVGWRSVSDQSAIRKWPLIARWFWVEHLRPHCDQISHLTVANWSSTTFRPPLLVVTVVGLCNLKWHVTICRVDRLYHKLAP